MPATPKFSSGDSILISDGDNDCASGDKKLMGLKRKRPLEQDTIPTADMKQHRKISRCGSLVNYFSDTVGSSAVSDYGKQNKSSSRAQIILRPSKEIVRETQKSPIESPAMAGNEPIDCDSDHSSTSNFSSDDSEDEDGFESLLSAVV